MSLTMASAKLREAKNLLANMHTFDSDPKHKGLGWMNCKCDRAKLIRALEKEINDLEEEKF